MSLSPPSALSLTLYVGAPLLFFYLWTTIRLKRKPELSDFLRAGIECLFRTTGIVSGIGLVYFGITGSLLPGLTFDQVRPYLAIVGVCISVGFAYLTIKELTARLSQHQ